MKAPLRIAFRQRRLPPVLRHPAHVPGVAGDHPAKYAVIEGEADNLAERLGLHRVSGQRAQQIPRAQVGLGYQRSAPIARAASCCDYSGVVNSCPTAR